MEGTRRPSKVCALAIERAAVSELAIGIGGRSCWPHGRISIQASGPAVLAIGSAAAQCAGEWTGGAGERISGSTACRRADR